jgi:hypothetical protein
MTKNEKENKTDIRRAQTLELLKVMDTKNIIRDTVELIWREQLASATSEYSQFGNINDFSLLLFMDLFKYQELLGPIAELYEKQYTEEEIQDMIDFYKSTTGKKVRLCSNMMATKSYDIILSWFQKKLNNLKRDFDGSKLGKNNLEGGLFDALDDPNSKSIDLIGLKEKVPRIEVPSLSTLLTSNNQENKI